MSLPYSHQEQDSHQLQRSPLRIITERLTNLYFQIKADGCEFLSLNTRAFMSELQRQRLQRGCHGFETLFRASRDIIKGHAK